MDNVEALLYRIVEETVMGGREAGIRQADKLRIHLTDPGYVRVPVEPTDAISKVYEDYKSLRYNPANASERYYAKYLHAAMLAAAAGESHD